MGDVVWTVGAWLAMGVGLVVLWCAVRSHFPSRDPEPWDWDDDGSQW